MSQARSDKLPFGVKFFYGGAEFANSMIYTVFYTFGMFFFTDVARLSPAFAGFLVMAGTLWDAFADPIIGVISDHSRSRWGRRRPFLLGIAAPFGLASWLLFTDFSLSPFWSQVYFLVIVLGWFTTYALLTVPYYSLIAEMTPDYNERTSLVSYQAAWSQVASIIGGGATLVMAQYFARLWGSDKLGWSGMAAVLGLAAVPLTLLTWRVTRGYELFPQNTRIRFQDVYEATFKNRPFIYTMGLYTFGMIGMSVASGFGIYFMKYYMGFNEAQSSLAFGLLFGGTILWIPLISFISNRWGKQWAYNISMGVWAAMQGIGILLLKPGMNLLFYFGMFIGSGGFVAIFLLGWSMLPDVIEVDEFKTGQRREGLYQGIFSFVQKAACAPVLGLNGLILKWIGYVADAPQSQGTLLGIRILFSWGVALFVIIGIIFCILLPMTKKRHDALRLAIRLKKEGKEYDAKSLEALLR